MPYWIAIAAAVVFLFAVWIAWSVRRSGGNPSANQEFQKVILARFDSVLEATGRWREESRLSVQEKIGDLFQRVDEQNRAARAELTRTLDSVTKSLADQFEKLQRSNEQKLTEIRAQVEQKLAETIQSTTQSFDRVTERLSDLRVTNDRITEFTRDLQELQSILQAPRIRGEMGQTEMEQMLRQCLAPGQFELQHALEGGRVDAVIFNPQGELPIDCKFPLEQWRILREPGLSDAERHTARRQFIKAVREHMDSIAQKYIRPPHTLEFAVMYIPVEGVYYEVLECLELSDHAHKCRVVPASPLTFWALLQVIVMGFRGMQISEEARRINGLLVALRDDVQKFKLVFGRAADQLEHARRNMNEAAHHLDRVDTKLDTIHLAGPEGVPVPAPAPLTTNEIPTA